MAVRLNKDVHSSRSRAGFTLIELLVVISIIALLIGILLPALARARSSGMALKCLSNVRQLTLAQLNYGNEFGQLPATASHSIWGLDWSGHYNPRDPTRTHPNNWKPFNGVLWPYVRNEFAYQCPIEKRQANEAFSYTMPHAMGGIRPETSYPTFFRKDPERGINAELEQMPGLPVIIEEDEVWWNRSVQDGAWGNQDQVTNRHDRRGQIGYMDGSAGPYESSKGPDPEKQEPEDFEAWDVIIIARDKQFDFGPWQYTLRPYGWINGPN